MGIVCNVIPIVFHGRRINGHQPDAGNPEVLKIIQFPGKAAQIPQPVVAAVLKSADRYFVKNSVFVPKIIVHIVSIYISRVAGQLDYRPDYCLHAVASLW